MALETGRIKAESGDGANGAESGLGRRQRRRVWGRAPTGAESGDGANGAEANWPEEAKFQPRRAKPCDASIYGDRLGEREADRTLA